MPVQAYPTVLSPLIGIVILNWNNAPDTIECLDSVLKLSYAPFTVLVVDNGSTDDSVIRISASHPEIGILKTGKNLGYSGGNNLGIRHLLDKDAKFILLLNNDTKVEPDMLTELLKVAESGLNVGMAGPKVLLEGRKDTLFAAGSLVHWSRGEIEHRGMFSRAPGSPAPEREEPEGVDFLAGCGLLVSARFIEKAGGLDERYFLNYEDVEWGIRARRFGFEVFYAPRAILTHKVSASLGESSAANTYYMTRNASISFGGMVLDLPVGLRQVIQIMLDPPISNRMSIRPKYRTSLY
ncbi:MAG: glycosyltransferase family 2 protein [Terriglobia bacterium]